MVYEPYNDDFHAVMIEWCSPTHGNNVPTFQSININVYFCAHSCVIVDSIKNALYAAIGFSSHYNELAGISLVHYPLPAGIQSATSRVSSTEIKTIVVGAPTRRCIENPYNASPWSTPTTIVLISVPFLLADDSVQGRSQPTHCSG